HHCDPGWYCAGSDWACDLEASAILRPGVAAGRLPVGPHPPLPWHGRDLRLSGRPCGSGIARPTNALGDVGWRTEGRSIGPRRKGIPVMKSPFRPDEIPDPAILDDHRPLIRSMQRRGLLRGGLSLGALAMLTGCDVDRPASVEAALLAISRLNDNVQALLFDPNKLAPT